MKQKQEEKLLEQQKRQEPVEQPGEDPEKKSKWISLMNKQKAESLENQNKERDAKIKLFKSLLEESEDEGDVDYSNLAGANLMGYLNKVQSHLDAEKKMIGVWASEVNK